MGKYLDKILCFLLLLLVINTNAQTYPFSNLTINNGLSNEQVLSVFQGDDGVIWFGTSGGGITKFDGKSTEYITVKDGLPDNVVFAIAKDKKGRILIGTNNGLSVFDPFIHVKSKAQRFKNYTTKDGLISNEVYNLFQDQEGYVWFFFKYGTTSVMAAVAVSIEAIMLSTPIMSIIMKKRTAQRGETFSVEMAYGKRIKARPSPD